MNKFKRFFVILLIALLTNKTLQETDFAAEVEKYCSNIDFSKLEEDGEARQKTREDNEPPLSIPYADLVKVINDSEYGKLAQPAIVVLFIIAILLFIFTIGLFIGILCSFCCCKAVKKNSKEKCYFITTIVLIVCFLLFLILMLVYAGKAQKNIEKIQCVAAKFPNDILNGKKDGDIQFIGFEKLIDMLNTFKGNLDSFNELEAEFDNVTALNIPGVTQSAVDSITPYEQEFTDKSSSDGNGSNAVSIVIQGFPDTMKIIKAEFDIYNKIGTEFNTAATEAKKFKDAAEVDDAKKKLDEAIAQINDVKTSVKDLAEDFFDYISQFSSVTKKVYVSDLVIALINLALFLWVVVILFCQSFKKKCLGCSCLIKIVLVVLTFLCIALSIISIALLVMSLGFGSSCNLFEEILTTSDFKSILTDLKLDTGSDQTGDILNGCVSIGGKGGLEDLVGNVDFGDLNSILDGFADFDKLKANMTNAPEDSVTISNITIEYQKFNDGVYINQEKAIENLVIVNNQIDCDDQFMSFNSVNCTDGSSCKVVSSMESYSVPPCADSSVSSQFTNLKAYDNGNKELMTDMITKLKGPDPNTPNSHYKNVLNVIKQAFSSYDTIKAKLKDTIDFVIEFSQGFAEVANCRIVRLELLYFEDSICFGFNENLFRFFLFTLLFTMFMSFMILSICCTMRHSNNKKKQNDDNGKENFYNA